MDFLWKTIVTLLSMSAAVALGALVIGAVILVGAILPFVGTALAILGVIILLGIGIREAILGTPDEPRK